MAALRCYYTLGSVVHLAVSAILAYLSMTVCGNVSVQVNEPCADGYTPLHYASRHGHTDCVKLLLSHGATVDSLSQKKEYVARLVVDSH